MDGAVWAGGDNYVGQPGNGTTTISSVPVEVAGLPEARSIEALHSFVYAIPEDGAVWAWGNNDVGELGNGTTTDSSVPVSVSRING